MNPWLMTGMILSGCLLPCADMCLRGSPERRLVGVEMTGVTVTLVLILLTVGTGRLVFMDLPLTLAIMSFGGGLVFARFLEKHL
jgi:multisubunit Na+/H+ antiporter MnhF subunit